MELLRSDGADPQIDAVVSMLGDGQYGAMIRDLGYRVEPLQMFQKGRVPSSLLQFRRLVKIIRPDIIHGWMYHANLTASLIANSFLGLERPRVIWGVRHSLDNLELDSMSTRRAIALSRVLARGADQIVYNSRSSAQQHEQYGFPASKTNVIANGFETERWRPDPLRREAFRKELGLTSDAIAVGFVARYNPLKNIQSFFRVMASLMESNKNVHAVIVGRNNGPENPKLKPFIERLPPDRTHILGERRNTENVFPGLDIFCLCSTSEAFPNVLGEAMSCGVPVVSTDVGDASYIVGETGYLVPPGSDHNLKHSLSELCSLTKQSRESLGREARIRIVEKFSKGGMVQNYQILYSLLMARKK